VSNRPNRKPSSSAKVAAARGGGGTPTWIFVVIGVVLLGGIALAVAFTQDAGDDNKVITAAGEEVEALVFGEPTVLGEALPRSPDAGPDPALGLDAPGLAGQAFNGERLVIPEGDGARIVMFLAHWCPHCQAEVPRIVDWLEASGLPEGVDLYAVATGTDETAPNYPPAAWLAREGWPVATLVDDPDGTAASAFGLSGFPYFVAVGPDGTVVQRTSGQLTEAQLVALVDAARAGAGAPGSLG